jgi:ribosomal protein L11 methyltransferase
MQLWNYLLASVFPADLDRASGILWSLGTIGIEEFDSRSGKKNIRAYFSPAVNIQELREKFADDCHHNGIRCYGLSFKQEKEIDWLKNWHENLNPFPVGLRFYVIPERSKGKAVPPGKLPLYLEPGMAFGTGTHETTQLCLESLERELTHGDFCLDIGTGSGILAIAAAKLGAREVIGCDLDPIAIRIASTNGVKNRCASRVKWVLGDISKTGKRKCNLLVANLTFEIIEQDLSRFESRLEEGGIMVLSGLLIHQANEIDKLKSPRLFSKSRQNKGEWSCLVYHKEE